MRNYNGKKNILIKFLFAMVMMINISGCGSLSNSLSQNDSIPNSSESLVENEKINLETFGGILGTMYQRITDKLYEHGNSYYLDAYRTDKNDLWNAEPEFGGKFILICSTLGGRYLPLAKEVVDKVKDAQRSDGYLGCLPDGNELVNFSIWNQAFTILGLVEYYQATGDQESLEVAKKCGDFIDALFRSEVEKGNSLTNAINGGSQHITSIIAFVRLYKATKDIKYLKTVELIVDEAEKDRFNLLSFDTLFNLKSRKGIEMIVVYLGLVELAEVLKDPTIDLLYDREMILSACQRFWECINDTQIRNTGGATTGEWFRLNGNSPAMLKTSEAVNENCVSVGWVELSSTLFWTDPQAKYLDAIEKTLFNSILGAVSTDGSDFSYYQGNYGRKEFTTSSGMYKCCRMRGINIFAALPDMMYKDDGNVIIPAVYTQGSYRLDNDILISCKTNYPEDGIIHYDIHNIEHERHLKLRIPNWCSDYTLKINDSISTLKPVEGYIDIPLGVNKYSIELNLKMEVRVNKNNINKENYYDFNYGPLLLVHDRHNGTLLKECRYNPDEGIPSSIKNSPFNHWDKEKSGSWYFAHFKSGNLNLVDYASTCRVDEELDMFQTYIKEKEVD